MIRWILIMTVPWLWPAAGVSAEPLRVALLLGNNRGDRQEVELLYAQSDASTLARVLTRYGSFRAEDVAILLEGNAAEAEKALITLNDRIRRELQDSNREVLLFVYYSGHADREKLHLGNSALSIETLRRLVRGSAATFRVLVLDSCKSGSLTRVKGGRPAPPFEIEVQDRLGSEGTVMVTSSAIGEDSQESDQFKGSIFTHHLVSGLLGAADESDDGQVSLSEAYRYAHEQTIKSTSRTWAGTQHPTYQYDAKGKGDVVLTVLALDRPDKAALRFAEAGEYLVLKGGKEGVVVAEVISDKPGRRLVLEPGRYFIRLREREELREGEVDLPAGREVVVDPGEFDRIRYARLVRKGQSEKAVSHCFLLASRLRGEILSGMGWQSLFGVGYSLAFRYLTVTPRLSFGYSEASNTFLRSTTHEFNLTIEATHAFDWWVLTFSVGPEAGLAYIHQGFETQGMAPDRDALGFTFGGIASLATNLVGFSHLQVSVEATTYVLRQGKVGAESKIITPLTFVFGLTVEIPLF